MGIPVKLEVFEGPLDLLLHLIDKNNIDFYKNMNKFISKLPSLWELKELEVCNKGTEITIY